jgi:transposase
MVYTSPSKVSCIVDHRRLGQSQEEIANSIGIHRTTVTRILKRFKQSGDVYHVNPKTGRPRKMEIRECRVAARMLSRVEAANATEVQKKAFPNVSARTVQRRLKEQGLLCRVRRSKPYISPTNKEKRRLWAMQHIRWTVEDWRRVIFSDESKFMLFKSDGRQYCWIKPGQALDPRFTKKTIKHGAGSLMVWGCVTGQGMGRIHRIEGIMCGPDYVEILNKSYLGTLKDLKLRQTGTSGVIFQQDNDPKHRSKVAEAWFQAKRVKRLPWPPSSPDMNIIEHVWDQLDALVRARNPLPRNKEELWVALQEEWANFPQAALDKLFESMPRRVAALLKARGGHTKY